MTTNRNSRRLPTGTIKLSSELIFPLLGNALSSSERLAQQFSVAKTVSSDQSGYRLTVNDTYLAHETVVDL